MSKLLNLGDALIKAGIVASNRVHRRHKLRTAKEHWNYIDGLGERVATQKLGRGELDTTESDLEAGKDC